MTPDAAEDVLSNHATAPKSKIAQAVSVLLQAHKTYSAIPLPNGLSQRDMRAIHKIAALPPGIQWKVDDGELALTQAAEIAKLPSESDQWLLAIFAIKEKLPRSECRTLVNAVKNDGEPMDAALRRVSGVHIDNAPFMSINMLALPRDWLRFTQAAWTRRMSLADFCYQAAKDSASVNMNDIADELSRMANSIRQAKTPVSDDKPDPLE